MHVFIAYFVTFSDLEGSRSPCIRDRLEQFHVRRLESLRFWLLHAIGSIHTYLSGQVLQSLGFILEKVLAEADSLDIIISGNDCDKLSLREEKKFSLIFNYVVAKYKVSLREILKWL